MRMTRAPPLPSSWRNSGLWFSGGQLVKSSPAPP